MYSTHTYQRRREQERIYKLYNKDCNVLQLNIEQIPNESYHYRGPVALGIVTSQVRGRFLIWARFLKKDLSLKT